MSSEGTILIVKAVAIRGREITCTASTDSVSVVIGGGPGTNALVESIGVA